MADISLQILQGDSVRITFELLLESASSGLSLGANYSLVDGSIQGVNGIVMELRISKLLLRGHMLAVTGLQDPSSDYPPPLLRISRVYSLKALAGHLNRFVFKRLSNISQRAQLRETRQSSEAMPHHGACTKGFAVSLVANDERRSAKVLCQWEVFAKRRKVCENLMKGVIRESMDNVDLRSVLSHVFQGKSDDNGVFLKSIILDHQELVGVKDGVNLTEFKVENLKLMKNILYQLLRGVSIYHSFGTALGCLKPQNVLIDNTKDEVKLQFMNINLNMDPSYKAPELLLGYTELTLAADMFAVGCIFGEMLLMRPLFSSSSTIVSIFSLMGTPNEENWPGVTELDEQLSKYEKYPHKELSEIFFGLEPAGVDLISKLLCLNPSKRITAADALKHQYFDELSVTATAAQASSSEATT